MRGRVGRGVLIVYVVTCDFVMIFRGLCEGWEINLEGSKTSKIGSA